MVDTRHWLAQSITRLNGLSPRPDLVVLSGDLVDEPSRDAYETLAGLLAQLTLPFVVIPGNHDERALLTHHFPDHVYLPRDGAKAHFSIEIDALRLIAFDAVVPGKEWASITPEDLEWLGGELAAATDQPTMLVMHHPPIATGLAFMDALQPPLHPGFAALVAAHPQLRLIACGHVHRVVDGMLAQAISTSACAWAWRAWRSSTTSNTSSCRAITATPPRTAQRSGRGPAPRCGPGDAAAWEDVWEERVRAIECAPARACQDCSRC